MNPKDTYSQEVEVKLHNWQVEMETLRAKIEHATVEASGEYDRQMESLFAKLQEVQVRLYQFKQAGGKDEAQLKLGLDQALTALEQGLEQTRESMKEIDALSMGWAEGLAEEYPEGSEGWAEGFGQKQKDSEGWAEGLGHQLHDSKGWAEGQYHRTGNE